MALVVVAAVVAGGIKVADALFGSDDTSAADDSDPEASTAGSTIETTIAPLVSEATTATTAAVQTPTAETVAPQTAAETVATEAVSTTDPLDTSGTPVVPSAATPAKVLIAGDSDAGTFGPYLVTLLDQTGVVDTELDYKVSSGLARPDFFDWPAQFEEKIGTADPDIVVVTFGGNDAQGLADNFGTFVVQQPSGTVEEGETVSDPEWRDEYGKRVGEVMDFLGAGGRTLIWVGIPNDDDDAFTARLAVQNEVVKEQVALHPGVMFIDTWSRFSGRDGNWAEYVIDPRDGQGKDVRSNTDGFHLNENGAEILALDIADAVRAALRERGAVL